MTAFACADDPQTIGNTAAGDCLEEGTGILGMLGVKKGFDLNTITDSASYAAAKTAGNIFVIKNIEAYWPSASANTIPGKAGRMERLGYINWELPFSHEGVDANIKFWNAMNNRNNYGVAFVTEEYKVFAPVDRDLEPVICQYFAVPAGEQEFGKLREFRGTVKWKSKDIPQLVDTLTKAIVRADFQP